MSLNLKNYYPYFDYLRFFLAATVMLSHQNVIQWHLAGSLAVDVFFALSGWLIGGILLKAEKQDLPRFYFNRAARIWIPYYIALVFIIAASLLKDPINTKWLEFVIYKVTWVYNLFGPPQLAENVQAMPLDGTGNHFWSINAEEQFYLLAPIILMVCGSLGRLSVTWLLIALMLLFLNTYAAISFGVLAAIIRYHYGDFQDSLKCRVISGFILITTSVGLYLEFHTKLVAPVFAIALVLLVAIKGKPQKFAVFLGGMSYALYLNQWIGVFSANVLLEPLGMRDSVLRDCLAAIFSLIIAAVLYQYVEKLCLEKRSQFYTLKRAKLIVYFAYSSIICGLIFATYISPNTKNFILLAIFSSSGLIVFWVLSKTTVTQTTMPLNQHREKISPQ